MREKYAKNHAHDSKNVGLYIMRILKQHKVGTFFGMAKIVLGQVSPYVNWLNLALVGVMSFYTTINPLFASWGIQLPFWVFLVALIVFVVIVLAGEYSLMLPSYFSAANVQTWNAENPQKVLLEQMDRRLEKIEKMLESKDV